MGKMVNRFPGISTLSHFLVNLLSCSVNETTEIENDLKQPIHFMLRKWRPRNRAGGPMSQSLSLSELGLNLRPSGPLTTYVVVEVKIQLPQQN